MNPQSREFKKLQKEWYKKLEDTGFKDAEDSYSLKAHSVEDYNRVINRGRWRERQIYFRLVGWFLYDHKFTAPIEKKIWTLRADGQSIRSIYRILKPTSDFICIDSIKKILKKLEEKMRSKYESTDLE